jgi:hypothetical protein
MDVPLPLDVPLPMDVPVPAPATHAEAEFTPSVLLDELESTARAKQARMERLRQQLLRLGEASRQAAAAQAQCPPGPPPANVDPSHAPGEAPTPPADGQTDVAASDAGAAAHDGHAFAPGDELAPVAVSTEAVPGTQIDRLALGDSLFATGQSDLALQAYSSIELKRLPAVDRYWIEYQIANCHRRLGNRAEAEQRYRRLAGLVDGGWCAAHARWWLDAMSTRTSLERDLEQVRMSLRTIEEQLNAKPAP